LFRCGQRSRKRKALQTVEGNFFSIVFFYRYGNSDLYIFRI